MEYIARNTDSTIVDDLKNSIRELAEKIHSKYPHLVLFSDSAQNKKTFELYRSYPTAKKQQIFADFIKYQTIVNSILENSVSNKTSLWVALKMFGVPSFRDDLFSSIQEDDVIEVYRYDGIQVFRNLNFHDICSYELPELFIYSWDQLYYREHKYTEMINAAAMEIFSGQHQGLMTLDSMQEHNLFELFSPKRYKLKMKQKYFYPLKNAEGLVEYGVAVSSVTIEDLYTQLSIGPTPQI